MNDTTAIYTRIRSSKGPASVTEISARLCGRDEVILQGRSGLANLTRTHRCVGVHAYKTNTSIRHLHKEKAISALGSEYMTETSARVVKPDCGRHSSIAYHFF